MAYSHASVDCIPEYGEQKDASIPKLNFFNALTNLQKKEKIPGAHRKKWRILCMFTKQKMDMHFFRAMANLS